ncbi:hypothetical protein [Streptomyces sp. NPDC058855]|uniref:hypothetical protein n=1 Tax=Streptomyces sp. NPDC058855 TaxID=3346651 RepID=UPI0036B90475
MARAPAGVRLLVVCAHRAHRAGVVVLAGAAVRADAGVVVRLGERVLETAQPVGGEIEGFPVRAELPHGPQRRHVDRLPATSLRLLVVEPGLGRLGREQLLGRLRLLVDDDVVRPAPHGGGGDDAQRRGIGPENVGCPPVPGAGLRRQRTCVTARVDTSPNVRHGRPH